MTKTFLETFEQKIKSEEANVFAIAEYNGAGIQAKSLVETNPCQNVYSVAKTYIVTAIGLLVDQGKLTLEETLVEILADELPETYHEIWINTTVERLLLHRVGLEGGFLDIDSHDATTFGEDYLSYVLNAPIRKGYNYKSSTYTDAAYYLLSRIVEKRAGMGTDDFLWKYLFYPTGCREVAWSHCPQGHVIGATGLYIRVEDLVKLGSIYLNGGTYGEKRILSESWVQTVFSKGYEFKRLAYAPVYAKGGMRGQKLMILPEANRVVAWTGCGEHDFTEFVAEYEFGA